MRRMPTHNISYRVLKDHMGGEPAHREVAVCATPEELEALGRDGFLIREAAVGGDWLQSLRVALDRLTQKEWPAHRPPLDADGAASLVADDMPARSWRGTRDHSIDTPCRCEDNHYGETQGDEDVAMYRLRLDLGRRHDMGLGTA